MARVLDEAVIEDTGEAGAEYAECEHASEDGHGEMRQAIGHHLGQMLEMT